MKSFVFLVCLSFVLAFGAIDANQPYEKVKPFTFFQVIEIPVSSGYVETEYNLKPVYIINCSVNERDADRDLFESMKIYRDYQKLCISTHKRAIESFERLCPLGQQSERPSSSSKTAENHPEEPTVSANLIDLSSLSKRNFKCILEAILKDVPESWSNDQKISFFRLLMDINTQYREALHLASKLKDLPPKLVAGDVSAKEVLGIFDFSALTNVTEFAKFHKFESCNQFNEVDSTFKVKLLEANVIPTKQIIKLDPFRYLDSQGCLVSYAGPELFVYDSSNQTYCPLQSSLFEFVNENNPLDDGCQPFIEPDLLFHRNCSAQLDPKNLIQVKDYDQYYYIYCYGSEVKFNDDAPFKCPNSVFRTLVNNTVSIGDRVVSFRNQMDRAVRFDDETSQKLIQVFQQTITE